MARSTSSFAAFALLAAAQLPAQQRSLELTPLVDDSTCTTFFEGGALGRRMQVAGDSAPVVLLQRGPGRRDVMVAVQVHEGQPRATLAWSERPQDGGSGDSPAHETQKAVPSQLLTRLDELLRAMLRRVRHEEIGPDPGAVETMLFLVQQPPDEPMAGRADAPQPGTRPAMLVEVGEALIAFVETPADAPEGGELAALARLHRAMTALERRLVTEDAPGPADQAGGRPEVDLRAQIGLYGVGPRPQGARPTCSIFTTVSAFEFALARATGRGQRLSVDYCNWAANAATGRRDDGDFFHCALAGWQKFGMCHDELWPYAAKFRGDEAPPAEALVDGGRVLEAAQRLRVRWIRPIGGGAGLDAAQMADLHATLAAGWPIAAGSSHSRLLVGYRRDEKADGGGVFLTMDSALNRFAEVPLAFVRDKVNDAFVVELRP
ncbi:MAG: hypothetical protein H6835_09290 [Planctomycetes bacterium]|nr:hypothetical protein [Planctomycetota bacterium]